MLRKVSIAAALALGLSAGYAAADVPAGYPADYAGVIDAAKKEGKVVVFSPTEATQVQSLLKAFAAAHPDIAVEWNDITVTAAYNRVISEAAANQTTGDLVWSNAMDLQLKLVAMGNASTYESPEAKNLPAWAKYKNAAYSTTIEPAILMYNKALFPVDQLPKSHADLTRLLKQNKEAWNGKVATFDPEKSGTGFLWMRNNDRLDPNFWALVEAFGGAGGKVYSSSGQFREKVLSGEHLFAFDMNGAYVREWAKTSSNIGTAFYNDYTQTMSRVVVITKAAPHPNAARVFLDFMLSKEGQTASASAGLPAVRSDVTVGENVESLNKLTGGTLKPLALDETLLNDLEPKSRVEFLAKWKKALQK